MTQSEAIEHLRKFLYKTPEYQEGSDEAGIVYKHVYLNARLEYFKTLRANVVAVVGTMQENKESSAIITEAALIITHATIAMLEIKEEAT